MKQDESNYIHLDVIRIPASFQRPRCFRTYETIERARECLRACQNPPPIYKCEKKIDI